jgi:integrase
MSVKIRNRNGRLYLDIIQNRQHHEENLHIKLSTDPLQKKEQLRLAEICRAKRESQLLCGEWDLTDSVAGKKTLIQYMKELAAGKSEKTPFVRTVHYLEQYRDGGNIQLAAVTEKWVFDFQKYLLDETGLSQMTASHYSTAIRQVLNTAVKEKIINSSPAVAVKNIPVPETHLPTLTVDELRRLAGTPISGELGQEVKRGFLFACYCGLRISDISTLQWKDIETRPVNKFNQCPNWIRKTQVKTRNVVEIPLTAAAWNIIAPRGFPNAYVFPKLANSGTHTDKYIKTWAQNAGIEKVVSWHTARRTFATLELENGVDPFTVQRLMGHKKIEITSHYAQSDRIKAGAVNTLADITNEADADTKAAGSKE